jgi:toxin CptA
VTGIWLAAIACVAAMGFAIQRGATCTVAAVDEMLQRRSARRLLAMLEASLWVAGGLVLAQLGHLAGSMPPGYAASAWTVIGGALLGLGAWINRACVFGAVARLGSGEWAYALTPLGFFVGCLSVMTLFPRPPASTLDEASPIFQATKLLAPCFVLFLLWRIGSGLLPLRRKQGAARLGEKIWAPHTATIVIGVSFVITLLLAGRWAYTDVLADLARAMGSAPAAIGLPLVLLLALYTGALVGGRSAGLWRSTPINARQFLRCFAGGVVMGWGSLLIPGSNDGLILIGIPLLRPYAWLAFASMFGAIAAAMLAQRAWVRNRPLAP